MMYFSLLFGQRVAGFAASAAICVVMATEPEDEHIWQLPQCWVSLTRVMNTRSAYTEPRNEV